MLTNQARRTARYDVKSAWDALLDAKDPKEILVNERLLSARAEINEEVEKHTHTPPKFSKDGKIAILRIHTPAQIHPVIATRWVSAYFPILSFNSHQNTLSFPPSPSSLSSSPEWYKPCLLIITSSGQPPHLQGP